MSFSMFCLKWGVFCIFYLFVGMKVVLHPQIEFYERESIKSRIPVDLPPFTRYQAGMGFVLLVVLGITYVQILWLIGIGYRHFIKQELDTRQVYKSDMNPEQDAATQAEELRTQPEVHDQYIRQEHNTEFQAHGLLYAQSDVDDSDTYSEHHAAIEAYEPHTQPEVDDPGMRPDHDAATRAPDLEMPPEQRTATVIEVHELDANPDHHPSAQHSEYTSSEMADDVESLFELENPEPPKQEIMPLLPEILPMSNLQAEIELQLQEPSSLERASVSE